MTHHRRRAARRCGAPSSSPRRPASRSARTRGSAACCSTPTATRSPRASTAAPARRTPRSTRSPRPGDAARGATAVVTLEPCNHTGRTGPCAQALVEAGVRRVVFAQADPNPVAAGGAATLARGRRRGRGRAAGRRGARAQPGLDVRRRARPPVRHLEVRHHPRRPQRRRRRHQPLGLQPRPRAATPTGCAALCDVMLVGTNTVAVDDPELTVRDEVDEPLAAPAAARGDGGARPRPRPAGLRRPAPRPSTCAPATRARRWPSSSPATASTSSSRAGRRWPPRSSRPAWSTRSSPTSRRCCSAPAAAPSATSASPPSPTRSDLDGHRRRPCSHGHDGERAQRPAHHDARPKEDTDVHRNRRGARHRRGRRGPGRRGPAHHPRPPPCSRTPASATRSRSTAAA